MSALANCTRIELATCTSARAAAPIAKAPLGVSAFHGAGLRMRQQPRCQRINKVRRLQQRLHSRLIDDIPG